MGGPAGAGPSDEPQPGPLAMELLRVSVIPDGAFGVLLVDRIPFALTLERTYDGPDGAQTTKIPVGKWPCRRTYFHRGGYDTYEVLVPGHSRLLFHRGNLETDSEGCILVGLRLGMVQGHPAIFDGAAGLERFLWYAGIRSILDLSVREIPAVNPPAQAEPDPRDLAGALDLLDARGLIRFFAERKPKGMDS